MPYRTRLELTSGDRTALDAAVASLRSLAEAKGADVAGPHTRPVRTVTVPLFKRIDGDDRFDTWEYDVYVRELTVTGYDEVTRTMAAQRLPDSVAVALTIDHIEQLGRRR